MTRAALLAIVLAGGCLRDTQFHCTTDSQCGSAGQCEANGYCSVPSRNCVDGRQYAQFSGSDTGQCVLRTPPADAGIDTGPACAPSFAALPGAPGHVYHLITTPADFTTQRTACSMMGGITYLAIPDSAAELQALVTLAARPAAWVGLDDLIVHGTYLTVRGQPAPYLPWAAGQPDDSSGANCVAALPDATLADQPCTNPLVAVCECEP